MQLTNAALLLSAIATLSSALPVKDALDKRTCGAFLLPTTQIALLQNDNCTSYPNTAWSSRAMTLSQDVSFVEDTPKITNKRSTLIAFEGLVGAYGCTLGITFPPSYNFSPLTGTNHKIAVYAVPTPLPSSPTYSNIISSYLFGYFDPLAVVGKSVVINSKSCPTAAGCELAFLFKFADEVVTQASIGWVGNGSEGSGIGNVGVYLNYNC